jgi:anti-sigma B factor antagonist
MQIDVTTQDQATVIRPGGERIDIEVAGELRTALLGLIESGKRNLVMDLGGVTFIDSSGLGALVSAFKTLKTRKQDGDIRLANAQPSVVELLEIIRLNRVFSSYPSVEQAVHSYTAPPS